MSKFRWGEKEESVGAKEIEREGGEGSGSRGDSEHKKTLQVAYSLCIIVSLFIFPSKNARKQVFFSTFNLL